MILSPTPLAMAAQTAGPGSATRHAVPPTSANNDAGMETWDDLTLLCWWLGPLTVGWHSKAPRVGKKVRAVVGRKP